MRLPGIIICEVSDMAIVEMKNVSRVYVTGDHEQRALDNVDLSIEKGKLVVVLGLSGAGKSTLLNILGGLDSPTDGTVKVDGYDISKLSNDELAEYRAEKVGFVFQSYNLIPTLTVFENVSLVKEISKKALDPVEMLDRVGLADNMKKFPSGLPAGLGTLQWMISALASEYEMKLMLGPLTYTVSILLTFGVSLIVGWMVARKNKKIDMVEALKTSE